MAKSADTVRSVPRFVVDQANLCKEALAVGDNRARVAAIVRHALAEEENALIPCRESDWLFPSQHGIEEAPGCVLILASLNDFAARNSERFKRVGCDFVELHPFGQKALLEDSYGAASVSYGAYWIDAVKDLEAEHEETLRTVIASAISELESKTSSPNGGESEKEWHICNDCLDPLADDLWSLALRLSIHFDVAKRDQLESEHRTIFFGKAGDAMDPLIGDQRKRLDELSQEIQSQTEPPTVRDVESLYRKYETEFAAGWLKFNVSVDYASDFQQQLESARRRFAALEFKACQIISGKSDTETTIVVKYAIQRLIDRHYESLHGLFPDHGHHPERDELPDDLRTFEVEFLDEYAEIENQFRELTQYLKRVSLLVRSKMKKAAQPTANPPGQPQAENDGKPNSNQSAVGRLKTRLFTALLRGDVAAKRLTGFVDDSSPYPDCEAVAERILRELATLGYKVNEVAEMPLAELAALCSPKPHDTLAPVDGKIKPDHETDNNKVETLAKEVDAIKKQLDKKPTKKEREREVRLKFIRSRVDKKTWPEIATDWLATPKHEWKAEYLADAMRLFWDRYGDEQTDKTDK